MQPGVSTDVLIGEGRYRLVRRLGRGGMGAVYEARDLHRDETVALKVLLDPGAEGIALFKNEFRALTDISHPNLVGLFELLNDETQWFFTMELVEGQDLLTHLSGPALDDELDATTDGDASTTVTDSNNLEAGHAESSPNEGTSTGAQPRPMGPLRQPCTDFEAVRRVFRGLAEGLMFLHANGKLHRDIKPSNVLVTPAGRVVILDFGIVTALAANAADAAGTPMYMAPEQIQVGGPLSPAVDFYSMGTMLYQVLTGRLPFTGSSMQVLANKQFSVPQSVRQLRPDIPMDLAQLCDALLLADPAARPTGRNIVAALASTETGGPGHSVGPGTQPIVGRDRELNQLNQLLAEVVGERRSRSVLVSGRSGMGKTSLLDEFLHRVQADESALVIRGRCYERERVPYKSIDNLIDGLARAISSLDPETQSQIVETQDAVLEHVFPAFGPIFTSLDLHAQGGDAGAFGEIRRQAFASIRRVLERLSTRQPLVLFIDDIQWGDVESLPLVEDLIRESDLQALVIVGFREEERERSNALSALLRRIDAEGIEPSTIHIGQLSHADLLRLAEDSLAAFALPTHLAERIADEANGSAYLVQELVRYAASLHSDTDWLRERSSVLAGLSVDQVLQHRIDSLSDASRAVLYTVCVAGAPVAQSDIQEAAGLNAGSTRALLELRAGQLVRTYGARPSDEVEAFHDRVRESVLASLSESEICARHHALACTLDRGELDVESLYLVANHYARAGALSPADRTFELNMRAAQSAVSAHAYSTADEYLTQAYDVADGSSDIALDASFYELRAQVSFRRGRAADFEGYGRQALDLSQDVMQRARIYNLFVELLTATLRSDEAYAYGAQALRELGFREPDAWGLTKLVGELIGSGFRGLALGTPPLSDEGRQALLLRARILASMGTVMYTRLEQFRPLCIAFTQHLLFKARKAGDNAEHVVLYALFGAITAAIQRRRLAMGLFDSGMAMAERMQDRELITIVRMYRCIALQYLGEPVESERRLERLLREEGDFLDMRDFAIFGGLQAWNLILRGRSMAALHVIEDTYKRALAEGETEVSAGIVHHAYAGSALALLGREEESDARLALYYRAHFDNRPRPSIWATCQYWSHRLLQLVELRRSNEEIEHAVQMLREIQPKPWKFPHQLRHCVIAESYWHLRRAQAEPSTHHLEALKRAVKDLTQCGGHPTFRAHALVISGAEDSLRKQSASARKHLLAARTLAIETENAWAEFEAICELGRLDIGADSAEQSEHCTRALELTRQHGWMRREQRLRAEQWFRAEC